MSRLRERLRTTTPAMPNGLTSDPDWERCEIVPQYVSGSINLQYRFRAVARRGAMTYTAGASPPFLTTPPPILPTEDAQSALTTLLDLLLGEGWQVDTQTSITPWYARTLRRALPKHGKPPPTRRRSAHQRPDA